MTVIVHHCHPRSITGYESISGLLLGGSKDDMQPNIMRQPLPGVIGADHYAFEAYKSMVFCPALISGGWALSSLWAGP